MSFYHFILPSVLFLPLVLLSFLVILPSMNPSFVHIFLPFIILSFLYSVLSSILSFSPFFPSLALFHLSPRIWPWLLFLWCVLPFIYPSFILSCFPFILPWFPFFYPFPLSSFYLSFFLSFLYAFLASSCHPFFTLFHPGLWICTWSNFINVSFPKAC